MLGGLGLSPLDIVNDIKEVKSMYPDSPQIILLDHFNDSTLHKLYNTVDCYIS